MVEGMAPRNQPGEAPKATPAISVPALPAAGDLAAPARIVERIGKSLESTATLVAIVENELEILKKTGISDYQAVALALEIISDRRDLSELRQAECRSCAQNYINKWRDSNPQSALRFSIYSTDKNQRLDLTEGWSRYSREIRSWLKQDNIFGEDIEETFFEDRFNELFSDVKHIATEILSHFGDADIAKLVNSELVKNLAELTENDLLGTDKRGNSSHSSFNPIPLQLQLLAELLPAKALASLHNELLQKAPDNIRDTFAIFQISQLSNQYGSQWFSYLPFSEIVSNLAKLAPNIVRKDSGLLAYCIDNHLLSGK